MRVRLPVYSAVGLLALLAAWECVSRFGVARSQILPAPSSVLGVALERHGTLVYHLVPTLSAIVISFFVAAAIAVGASVFFVVYPTVGRLLDPIIVASQVVPKITLAPIFLLWLGFGIGSKIAIASLIAFFPTYVNAVRALRADDGLRIQHKLFGESRLSFVIQRRLPASLPALFAGLRATLPLSVVGVIIGEFVGSNRGLGYFILERSAYDSASAFAGILVTALLGGALFVTLVAIERIVLRSLRLLPEGRLLDIHS